MLWLFGLTIFVGAGLLFVVQPLFGRLLLPLLGGAPAVWNTSMLFFQATLLAGYGYAHLLSRRLSPRRQLLVHGAVLVVAALSLPIAIPRNWTPPTEHNPIGWLLATAALAVGLPFFAVSATSPLLQRWLSLTRHPAARDPYFLYSASNLGSLLALLGYPILIEPRLGLVQQSRWWAVGFGVLGVLLVMCAGVVWRRGKDAEAENNTGPQVERASRPVASQADVVNGRDARSTMDRRRNGRDARSTRPRRLWWVGVAFVPSSLMLSVTSYISMDLAAIPLLWVVPLALYLATFSLAFARRRNAEGTEQNRGWKPLPRGGEAAARLLRLVLIFLVVVLAARVSEPIAVLIPLHLLGLFAAGMVCHLALASDRPAPQHLTEFYFWIALGGVLGGVFNALLAPVIFRSVLEYPLGLVLAAGVLAWGGAVPHAGANGVAPHPNPLPREDGVRRLVGLGSPRRGEGAGPILRDVLWPVGLGLATVALLWATRGQAVLAGTTAGRLLVFGVPALVCFAFASRPIRFALGLAALLVAGAGGPRAGERVLFAERTFFGIHRVVVDGRGQVHRLFHGTTVHGIQRLEPLWRGEPLAYYSRSGPLGQIMQAVGVRGRDAVALVGLGAGGSAAYAGPGQQWTVYEIDPVVERVARDPRLFTYLADCPAELKVVLGDARLTLRAAPDQGYQLLILDAYNSDAIPLHLITREAVRLYAQKLRSDGWLVWHITNRHLDLEPVLAALAQDAGWVCLVEDDRKLTPVEAAFGKAPSRWAVMARRTEDLGPLRSDERWQPARARAGMGVWTDDYAWLLGVLRWGKATPERRQN